MRSLYNLLIYLLQVPVAAYWAVRALFNRSYRKGFGQRFGFGYPVLGNSIWIHAVSVGEVQAAAPLVRKLRVRFPEHALIVTTVTPTGAVRVRSLFGDSVAHAYIPFEMPLAVSRFFECVRPEIALVMETEIWPNLYRGCGVRGIPLVLVSARISPRSVKGYLRFLPLFRETLSHGIVIAAQGRADAERFRSLGAASERTRVTGNIKFDIELPEGLKAAGEALRHELFGQRPVWVAASTHDGEEQQVLAAHGRLRKRFPDLLLVLVPRHPERFDEVRGLVRRSGFESVARTDGRPCTAETQVFVGDTMGELPLFYAAADIGFVGGSLVPIGSHNLLEPAALGLPVIVGPHVFNAQEIADLFLERGACRMVEDAEDLARTVAEFLEDPEAAADMGNTGREIVEDNRGALERLLAMVEPLLDRER